MSKSSTTRLQYFCFVFSYTTPATMVLFRRTSSHRRLRLFPIFLACLLPYCNGATVEEVATRALNGLLVGDQQHAGGKVLEVRRSATSSSAATKGERIIQQENRPKVHRREASALRRGFPSSSEKDQRDLRGPGINGADAGVVVPQREVLDRLRDLPASPEGRPTAVIARRQQQRR